MGDDLGKRCRCDKAEVRRAGRRLLCLRLELMPGFVEINLLGAEMERHAPLPEAHNLHAEHAAVESAGLLDAPHREHQVVEVVDLHSVSILGKGLIWPIITPDVCASASPYGACCWPSPCSRHRSSRPPHPRRASPRSVSSTPRPKSACSMSG